MLPHAIDNADVRISTIAQAHPNATALIGALQHMSFQEFEAETNNVTAYLSRRGIRARSVVAVCLTSCINIASVLRALIRLGAIFVPLDPEHPEDRINAILRDADAEVVVTTETLCSRLKHIARSALTIDAVDTPVSAIRTATVSLDDPACILYTSGSSGQPKGVLRLNRGIVCRLAWGPYEQDDVFCHNMSLCYGFSQERLFLPLMLGRPLVLLPDECQKDVGRLAREIETFGITQLTVVPAVLEQLVDSRHRLYQHCGSLRSVTVGSAFLHRDIIARFHEVLPQARLTNVYGSTESGTLTRGEMIPFTESNVGGAAPNMEVFILV